MQAASALPAQAVCAARRRAQRALASSAASSAAAAPAEERSLADYTRLLDDPGAAELRLQTSVVRLQAPPQPWRFWESPASVDLVAAVHVADESYFQQLAELLGPRGAFDSVLYECASTLAPALLSSAHFRRACRMVADQSAQPAPAGQRWRPPPRSAVVGKGWVSALQRAIASALQLSFQLREMAYDADHWHHADLTLQQFRSLQAAAGESLPHLAAGLYASAFSALWARLSAPLPAAARPAELRARLRILSQAGLLPLPLVLQLLLTHGLATAEDGPPAAGGLLARALRRPDAAAWLKLALASGLTRPEMGGGALAGGAARASVLLGARNDAALAALEERVRKGDRRCALFFGAAHMADMEAQLAARGWRRRGQPRWLDAWRIAQPGAGAGGEGGLGAGQAALLAGLSALLAVDLAFWEVAYRWLADAL